MITKALANLLLATSLMNFFPADGAILEWQAAPDTADVPLQGIVAGFMSATVATLPLAKDKIPPPPKKLDLQSFGVVTSARSAVVIDAASGATLFAKNPNEVRSIGSISKLMAVLVFLDTQPTLSTWVKVTPEDFAGTGRVYLYYNDPVRLEDVLGTALVGSDNTATLALVRSSGLSVEDFVARMNTKAIGLGMTNTKFEDPSGLSEKNVSTVGELAILLSEAKKRPDIVRFMTDSALVVVQANGRSVTIPSTNLLLSSALNVGEFAVTAGKTGYIPQAGYCLATAVAHEGHEVYVIVLGADDIEARFDDASALARWSFKTFAWPAL